MFHNADATCDSMFATTTLVNVEPVQLLASKARNPKAMIARLHLANVWNDKDELFSQRFPLQIRLQPRHPVLGRCVHQVFGTWSEFQKLLTPRKQQKTRILIDTNSFWEREGQRFENKQKSDLCKNQRMQSRFYENHNQRNRECKAGSTPHTWEAKESLDWSCALFPQEAKTICEPENTTATSDLLIKNQNCRDGRTQHVGLRGHINKRDNLSVLWPIPRNYYYAFMRPFLRRKRNNFCSPEDKTTYE